VLLNLAYHHNLGTGQCNPSVATISREEGWSSRAIMTAIAELERLGLIERIARRRKDGGKTTNEYRLIIRETHMQEVHSPHTQEVQNTPEVQMGCEPPAQPHMNELQIKNKESKKKESKNKGREETRARAIPPDWHPDAKGIEYAKERNVGPEQVELFRDYHLKNGNRYSDWNAAWRQWCRKAVEFRQAERKPNGHADDGDLRLMP
jgi:DNA-binding transcriptional MocR family regulator